MADIIASGRVRRRKVRLMRNNLWRLRDRENPFTMENKRFIKNFRLSKDAVRDLCEEMRPHFDTTESGYSIEMQICKMFLFILLFLL